MAFQPMVRGAASSQKTMGNDFVPKASREPLCPRSKYLDLLPIKTPHDASWCKNNCVVFRCCVFRTLCSSTCRVLCCTINGFCIIALAGLLFASLFRFLSFLIILLCFATHPNSFNVLGCVTSKPCVDHTASPCVWPACV